MISPFESSQVLQTSQAMEPAVSYSLVPETQYVPSTSYVAGAPQAFLSVGIPAQTSQIMTSIPQVPQISISQVAPTISMAPQVSQMMPSVSMAPTMSQLPPQPFQVPLQLPKPLTPSPPYEAFVPPTPITKSVSDNAPPRIYQFYQAVPVPPVPTTTATSFANVPMTSSINAPVTTSMNIPITNSYSTSTAPIPVAPSNSLLLETPQYQTATASSFI